MGIVLPDGILNNPGLRFLRSWLLKRARVIASIDLPKETFAVSGGVNNPSVLILQKFSHEQIQRAGAVSCHLDSGGTVAAIRLVRGGEEKSKEGASN